MGISHTVVNRHVRNLEAWICWKLLAAGPRGVVLTPEGQSLYSTTAVAFQSIANISAQLRAKPAQMSSTSGASRPLPHAG